MYQSKIYNIAYNLFLLSSLFIFFTFSWWQGAHSIAVMLLSLSAIVLQFNSEVKYKSPFKFWILTLPFVVLLFGLIHSTESSIGTNEIVRKLSLLIFPLVAMSKASQVWIENKSDLIRTFVYGSLLGVILSFATAIPDALVNANLNLLFYTRLSFSIHTTFFSMYLFTALLFLWYSKESFSSKERKLFIPIILITTFLLLSRAAILCLGISGIIIFISEGLKRSWKASTWLKLSVSTLIAVLILFQIPVIKNRVLKPFKAVTHSEEMAKSSTNVRVLMWTTAYELIVDKPLFGYGTGETSKQIENKNIEQDRKPLLEKKLNNAHNQYLNDWISNGLLAVISIFTVLFYPFSNSRIRRDYIFRFFVLMIGVNMLFDSVWNSQAGVIFYSFISVFLITSRLQSEAK